MSSQFYGSIVQSDVTEFSFFFFGGGSAAEGTALMYI